MELAARTAWVDVTGAVSTWEETCFGRSRRNRIGHPVAVFGLSYRNYFDRWYKSDSGHALLSEFGLGRFHADGTITFAFDGRPRVVDLTALLDGVWAT